MSDLPPPNWEEIKTRYVVLGQQPAQIAQDYDVSIKTIKNRVTLEGWKAKRADTGQEIREGVTDAIKAGLDKLSAVTLRVHTKFMTNLEGQVEAIQNPYLFDGERTNSLFQTAMNNSVKLMLAHLKADEEKPEATTEQGKGFTPVEGYDPEGI